MNPSRTCRQMKLIPPGCLLAAAATAWLAVAAVWPARADAVPGEEVKTRSYTLAEKSIQHAKENLPRQIYTDNPELTKLVHALYSDCLGHVFEALDGLIVR
jgi:hypothetical protein